MALTQIEKKASELFAQGLKRSEIAKALDVKLLTAVGYINKAKAKLNCKSDFAFIKIINELTNDEEAAAYDRWADQNIDRARAWPKAENE